LGSNTVNIGIWSAVLASGLLVLGASAQAKDYEVVLRTDIPYAERGGAKLLGDLYLPKG